MKAHDLFRGINEIDDDLIRETETIPVNTGMKIRRICTAAALLLMAAGLTAMLHNSKPEDMLRSNPEASVIISGETDNDNAPGKVHSGTYEQDTENPEFIPVTTSSDASTVHVENTEIKSSTAEILPTASDEPDLNEPPAVISPNDTDPTLDSCDGLKDGSDKKNFYGIPLEEWLNTPEVIWAENDLKVRGDVPLGTTRISPELEKIIKEHPEEETVFAVTVDFSFSIDEMEMNNWEYNGRTIAEIHAEIENLTISGNTNNEYIDDGSAEQAAYTEKIKHLKSELSELRAAYYSEKIQDFQETFEQNGLDIYTSSSEDAFFCTFGTAAHFYEFVCRENEAFIFYPAGSFK